MPERWLPMTGACNLTAAAGKPRRFEILAYTGGLLRVSGWPHPVVVDLQGIESPDGGVMPVLLDHRQSTETTLGQTDRYLNDGQRLVITGPVTGDSQPVQNVLRASDRGQKWQASIGGVVTAYEEIAAGQTVAVNGQTFTGPLIVARNYLHRETSVLPVGGDVAGTSVNLAAAAALMKGNAMSFEDWLASMVTDPSTLSDAALAMFRKEFESTQAGGEPAVTAGAALNLRATHAAELRRRGQIEAKWGQAHPLIAAAAIEQGWDENKTELEVLKAERLQRAPAGHIRGGSEVAAEKIMYASFALNCGMNPKYLEQDCGKDVIDAAMSKQHRGASYHTLIHHLASRNGEHGVRITDTLLRASFGQQGRPLQAAGSTLNLPGILSNVANKMLLQGFESVPAKWPQFCTVADLRDFKPSYRYRSTLGGTYQEIHKGGSIKDAQMTPEESYENQLKTYGKIFKVDRQDMINDDLDVFATVMPGLGRIGGITLEKSVFKLLLASNASLFTTPRGNRLSGAGTALSIDSLADAEEAFMRLVDGNGDYLMMEPSMLMVPPALSTTSKTLINSTQVVAVGVDSAAATAPGGNPHNNAFERVTAPWLENAGLTGHSSIGWYLLAKPMGPAGLMEVGFLNGQKSPTVEQADADFNELGVQFRGVHDWGVAIQDYRFGVYAEGTPAE